MRSLTRSTPSLTHSPPHLRTTLVCLCVWGRWWGWHNKAYHCQDLTLCVCACACVYVCVCECGGGGLRKPLFEMHVLRVGRGRGRERARDVLVDCQAWHGRKGVEGLRGQRMRNENGKAWTAGRAGGRGNECAALLLRCRRTITLI